MPRPKIISGYAARYGVDGRTIKRWRELGRIKGDEINLDSPAAVLAWWERHMSQRPTHGILQAAVKEGLSVQVADLIPRNRKESLDQPQLFDIDAFRSGSTAIQSP